MAPGVPTSAQRVSSAFGLCIVMLATLPRYLAGGNETRLSLIIMALVIVLVAVVVQWRMLSAAERHRLPGMCKRLAAMMVLGVLVMGAGTHSSPTGSAGRCSFPMPQPLDLSPTSSVSGGRQTRVMLRRDKRQEVRRC